MAALSNLKSPAKFYRCGICTNDFPTLNACVAHIKTHVTEPDFSNKTAASATNTVQLQLQASEPGSVGRKYFNNTAVPTTEPNIRSKLASSLQSFNTTTRAVTTSVPISSCKQKSILVQTDICGTVSVRADSRACAAQGPGRKATDAETCTEKGPAMGATSIEPCASEAQQGPARKATDVELKACTEQGPARKAADVESSGCTEQGPARKATDVERKACTEQGPIRKATDVESGVCLGQGPVSKTTDAELCTRQGQVRKSTDTSVQPTQLQDTAGSTCGQDPQEGDVGEDPEAIQKDSFHGHEDSNENAADTSHNVNGDKEAKGFMDKAAETSHNVNIGREAGGIQKPEEAVSLRPKASSDEDRPYACPECPCRYRFLSSLSVHKKRHFGSQPYQCKTCKKKFWHPTNLRVHERTHSQERPYQCNHCGHGFNQSNDLRIHTRIHTGELPLKCPAENCDRAFRDPACLRRHVNKHTGVQPHIQCDQCQAKFYHMSALERHYRKHTGQKDFVCDICNAAFARSDTLKLHKRVHSGQKPYACSVCSAHFSDRSYCRRHMRSHRGEQNARVISNLRGRCIIKQEPAAAATDAKEDMSLKVPAVTKLQPQPSQKRRPATVIPVEIPDPDGSDIPYASIEIEIPESDLADGDDSEDIVYQYGDMLITISRSVVELAEESAFKKDNPDQHSVDLCADNGSFMEPTVPFNNRQTEHQYSRVIESDKSQHKRVDMKSGQAVILDSAGHVPAGLDQITDSCDMTVSQPLSEYNETVTSNMESEFPHSKATHIAVLSAGKGKQRNPRVGERRWPCADCDAAFFHQAELRRHRTKHTGELPYQCTVCGKKVRDPSNLKRHIRTHTGERPYKCQVCEKSFSQAGHLTAHLRIHTGQRPFTCDRCPATFIEANHLRYHQKVHDGIKPFKCTECDLSFIRNAELRRHMHVHGSERPFKCDQCPAKYFRMDALKQHLSMKHQQKRPFRCDMCPQSFFKQSHLDRHRAHFKHQGGKKKDKVTDFKSDAVNSVVANALCELATGRRSAVINVKGSSVVSSSSESATVAVSRNSGPSTVNQENGSSVAGTALQVKSTPASSNSSHNSALAGSSALLMEEEMFGEGRNDESFVQRVMVDGGSVTRARVVMLESSQAMEVLDNVGKDSAPSSSCQMQTIHDGDHAVPQSSGTSTVVMEAALQDQTPSAQIVIEEQPVVMDESGYIIISQPDQTVGQAMAQLIHNGPVQQQAHDLVSVDSQLAQQQARNPVSINRQSVQQHPNPVSTLEIADAVVDVSSIGTPVDHQYVHIVEGMAVDTAQGEAAPSQVTPSGPVTAVVETHSHDSTLESTMQSLLSGTAQLESVKPIVRMRRSGGRPVVSMGGVVIKKEKQEARIGAQSETPSFVAPLKTRSGRERKIKVKFSA